MRPDPIKTTLLKLKPFIGKQADALWMRHQSSDWKERQDWEQTINTIAQKYAVDTVEEAITLPPPTRDLSKGEITLGTTRYLDAPGHEFSITDLPP